MNALLEKWKELLGQLEVVKTYYARLTERERYIVVGVGGGGILFILLSIYSIFLAATSSLASSIEENRLAIKQLGEVRASYGKTERNIRELDRLMRRTDPNFQLATHLERLAGKYGIAIDSVKDRAAPPNDFYQERQVAVALREVNIRRLIDFFFEIENSSEALLRITSLQIKPSFQDATQLNVTFAVSTFFPTGEP